MSGTSTVSRTNLLDWLNTLCALRLTSVQQTSSGAVACQVFDVLYPGNIPMNRVDWTATQPGECVQKATRYCKKCFLALQIDKKIPVDKLIHGKYQDNLKFLQWLKEFYDRHDPPKQPYDACAQRAKGIGGAQYNQELGPGAEEAKIATLLEKMQDMKIKSDGLKEMEKALKAEIQALREKAERIKDERDFCISKLETIAELVHNGELSKTTNAQTNLLGLSILDVLFATEEDEEENELPF